MQSRNLKLLMSLLDSKFVLTHESTSLYIGNFNPHQLILLDVSMPLFDFLPLEVTTILSGGCFLVVSSTISMLMTTFAHKSTCTRFGKHWPPRHCL
jgi:hypothetical protein